MGRWRAESPGGPGLQAPPKAKAPEGYPGRAPDPRHFFAPPGPGPRQRLPSRQDHPEGL